MEANVKAAGDVNLTGTDALFALKITSFYQRSPLSESSLIRATVSTKKGV